MEWYYFKDGQQLGPVSQEDLSQKQASGEVQATDLVWKEGMADWLAISQVAEFSGGASAAPAQAAQPANPPAGQPQQALGGQPTGLAPTIPNYLWQSIAVTVLCCMPFGVVSIIFAAKVDGLVAKGDIAGAQAASKNAKTWALVGLISGLVAIGLYILLVVAAGANGGY